MATRFVFVSAAREATGLVSTHLTRCWRRRFPVLPTLFFTTMAFPFGGVLTPSAEAQATYSLTPTLTLAPREGKVIASIKSDCIMDNYQIYIKKHGETDFSYTQIDLGYKEGSYQIINLENEKEVEVYVSATHKPGLSDCSDLVVEDPPKYYDSDTEKATPLRIYAAPSNVKAIGSDKKVDLTWDPISEASRWEFRYRIWDQNWPATWTEIMGSSASTESHTVTELTNGTTYNFQVRPLRVTARGDTIIGKEGGATAAPVPRPEAPTGLEATPGNQEVTLEWTNPDDDTITQYQYQQKLSSATSWGNWSEISPSNKDTTKHTVTTGLENDKEYAFRIRAIGNGGDGDPSAQPVTATPHIGPNRPQEFKLTPGNARVTLSWKAPQGNTTAGRWQYRELADGDPNDANANWGEWVGIGTRDITTDDDGTMEFTRVGTNGTAYYYELRGISADIDGGRAGGSPGMAARSGPAIPEAVPGIVSLTSAEPRDSSVILTWEEQNNAAIDRFEYRQKLGNNDITNANLFGEWIPIPESNEKTTTYKITTYTVTGLNNGQAYTFQVQARTAGGAPGRGGNSLTATPNTEPAKPVLSGEPERKGAQVTLRWTYMANTAEVDEWQYRQRERSESESEWGNWNTISGSNKDTREHTVTTGLDKGKAYDFQVRARTSGVAGEENVAGEESDAWSVLGAPTSLGATAGSAYITLNWTAPSGNPTGSYSYQYCYGEGTTVACDNSDWQTITGSDANTTSHDVTGLKGGRQYAFKVRVVSSAGGSAESNLVAGTPGVRESPPLKPTEFSATAGNGQVTLSWANANDGSIQKYQYCQKEGTSNNCTENDWTNIPGSSASSTSHTVPDLTNGTEYAFRIRAVNYAGNSDPSEEVTATPKSLSVLTLALSPNSISENGGVATVTATLDKISDADTTVTITAMPVSPAEEKDFSLSDTTTLTIKAGATTSTGTVTIRTNNTNTIHEAAKTVTITATATNSVSVISVSKSLTLTITDDDAPTLTLKLNPREVSEDGGVTTVTARLDKASSSDTTVTITAMPVEPAVAGDVALSENTKLIIKAGATTSSGTVTITAVDNDVAAADKTITISATADNELGLNNPADVTLTIIEDDTVAMEERRETATKVLTEVVHATLSGASAVIGQRFDAALGGPAVLSVADWQVGGTLAANTSLWQQLERWDGDLSTVNRLAAGVDLLTESNFSLPLNSARGGTWSIWGRGDWRGFEGTTDLGDYDGSQRAGYLGVDKWLNERLMAGLALSHSTSETDYTIEDEGGRIDTSLTSIWPYLQNTMDNGAQLRLVLGIGTGEVEHYPTGEAHEKTDLTMRAVSVAGKLPVAQPGDFTLSATAAASLADMKTEGLASVAAINGLHVSSWNLRAGLEAKHEGFPVSDTQWTLTPRVALALRQDGGDGVTGTGAELSGGLRLAAPDSRFALDASGYWLALHSQDGTKEWGASVEARFSPGEGGEGLSLSVEPAWGVLYQAGVLASEDLFEEERRVNSLGRLSLTAHAGYGFALTQRPAHPVCRVHPARRS